MSGNTHFIDNVVDLLRKSALELEQLQVQLALGKLEAKDKYEELKKDFSSFMRGVELKANDAHEFYTEYRAKFDELRVQLALGKAETIEAFREQKHKLLSKMHELEVQIKSHPLYVNWYPEVLAMFEKVKIQLDLLEAYFEEKKEVALEELEKRKEQMDIFIDDMKSKFKEKMSTDSRWDVFQDEMSLAYAHLKKAIFQ